MKPFIQYCYGDPWIKCRCGVALDNRWKYCPYCGEKIIKP